MASAFSCPAFGDAGDHAVLLLNRGIGGSRLHAAEFERLAAVLVEIGQDGRGPDGRGREAERRQRTHRTHGLRDRRAVFGDEHAGNAVIGPRALDVVLDDRDAIRLARADRPVQLLDRRLLKTKWRIGGVPLVRHVLGPSSSGHGVYIGMLHSGWFRHLRLPADLHGDRTSVAVVSVIAALRRDQRSVRAFTCCGDARRG